MDGLVCDNCSTPLPGGSKYCNECGTPVPGQGAPQRWANFPTDLRQALQMATAGEYEIHHELGRGGMGSVFLAREIGLDRLVAIKVLPPNLMFDEGLIERFKREARMVAKLHHPNIIPVYRVHHSHNLAFYTMHFVPGRSLNEIMGPNRVPSLPEVERIMLEAAAGLGYAHNFGIAKALVGSTQLTETGAVIGTPQYMAPEQCEGRMVDGRADQYSLAAVGYQLLVGHPPFESDSMKELLYHHLFTPPRPLNAIRPETPLTLRDAIHKALSKDPADRFDAMEDFRMAIEGKGPPVFVNWLDEEGERRRKTPPSGKHPFRRSGDPPTTERLPEAPWVNGNRDELRETVTAGHRRVMGGLAVAVVTMAVVTVFALTKGVGVADSLLNLGSNRDTETGAEQVAANLGQVDPSVPEELDGAGEDSSTPPVKSGSPAVEKPVGFLLVSGDLPESATLKVEGTQIDVALTDGVEIDLPPGQHRVVVSAAGFTSWSRDVYVEPGEGTPLTPALERVAVAEPKPAPTAVDRRPSVPRTLIDEFDAFMQQGQVFYDMGRYVDAGEAFREVEIRATEGIGLYRNDNVLRTFAANAKKAIEDARLACKLENQPSCP